MRSIGSKDKASDYDDQTNIASSGGTKLNKINSPKLREPQRFSIISRESSIHS